MMLREIDIENILFLDIETVPAFPAYAEVPDKIKKLWDHKAEFLKKSPDDNPERLYGRAGIYAEFGRIVCISAGFFKSREFRVKSYYGDDEFQLLAQFCKLINASYSAEGKLLCAHNGKEFDFPFLARRILIHGIPLPSILDTAGQKRWNCWLPSLTYRRRRTISVEPT